MRQRALLGLAAVAVLTLAACGGDDDDTAPTTTPATSATSAAGSTTGATTGAPGAGGDAVAAGQPFPAARCEQNKAAGKIRYLSGFDFAATASIIDVVMAKQRGYFDQWVPAIPGSPGAIPGPTSVGSVLWKTASSRVRPPSTCST